MNLGKTLFAQLMEFVPWTSFARIVDRYSGDARISALPSTEHFRIMAYAQLTWRESLRDIEATDGHQVVVIAWRANDLQHTTHAACLPLNRAKISARRTSHSSGV